MAEDDSTLEPSELARARALLARPKPVRRFWPVLTAAAVLALVAIAFAVAMVLAPPLKREHLTASTPDSPSRDEPAEAGVP